MNIERRAGTAYFTSEAVGNHPKKTRDSKLPYATQQPPVSATGAVIHFFSAIDRPSRIVKSVLS